LQNNTFSGESLRQKLIVLDEIGSTNDYLKSKLSNFKPLPEWTAIMAKNQTMGRGQRQNSWKSEPNSNITFSFVIYPATAFHLKYAGKLRDYRLAKVAPN